MGKYSIEWLRSHVQMLRGQAVVPSHIAAKWLGTTTLRMRRLCETGYYSYQKKYRDGTWYYVPIDEIAKDGQPVIPNAWGPIHEGWRDMDVPDEIYGWYEDYAQD